MAKEQYRILLREKNQAMKKITYLFILVMLNITRTSAQETSNTGAYKVPAAYHFDDKVTYEVTREEQKTPETVSYYFTKSGDYMGMETPGSQKDKDMNFMISTKNGLMITFGEEPVPNHSDQNRAFITVMDMRSLFKGTGEAMETAAKAMAKDLPEKDKAEAEKKKPNEMDNFIKTGKTKQVFGYTAEEYSKEFTKDENGKERSGTMSVWYAKVDFDPQMMFSMGMGNIAGGQAQSKMLQSHPNNMIGMGITQKDYLLVEMDIAEKGGKSGTAMKVVGIDKTAFEKSTEGYFIKNYSGMSMMQMMQKEREEK
jgi:hypothetical protein